MNGNKNGEEGVWFETDAYPHHVYCSKCYATFVPNREWLESNGGSVRDAEFCPHCGVRMRKGTKCACYTEDGRCTGTREIDLVPCSGIKGMCIYNNR